MGEPKRRDEELTTSDLAGRSEKPQLVRSGRPDEVESFPDSRGSVREAVVDENLAERREESREAEQFQRKQPTSVGAGSSEPSPLFSEVEINESRTKWGNIQTAFVDEPRRAVEEADSHVASLMKKLAEGFALEREKLEKQWDRGEDVSTEDLRIALQRYRSFFDRLLKA